MKKYFNGLSGVSGMLGMILLAFGNVFGITLLIPCLIVLIING
jgi:hypothetical protein